MSSPASGTLGSKLSPNLSNHRCGPALKFGYCNLEFICVLVLVFWYLALFIDVKRIGVMVEATPHVKIDIDLAV
jgi:hypothetical protein